MGRKPNPVVAAHFTRGRPETLFAHLANCPELTQAERAETISQMYNVPTIDDTSLSNRARNHRQDLIPPVSHDDFDITGLNVLAGAAENAEDLVIDPQIRENGSPLPTVTTGAPPLTFHDSQYGHHYSTVPTSSAWTFPFSTVHDSPSPFPDNHGIASISPSFTTATVPSLPQWSFAPVMALPTTYVAHPTHQLPISFAHHGSQPNEGNGNEDIPGASDGHASKSRKSKEPYNEPKRARVAEMRQVGACIRCSRLRKTCEPVRPCEQCRKTASKTWVGGCTSLHKGQEFSAWYEPHISRVYMMRVGTIAEKHQKMSRNGSRLRLSFFEASEQVVLDLAYVQRGDGIEQRNHSPYGYHLIEEKEDIAQKLMDYAIKNQELIVEAIDVPPVFATLRIAQGLSSPQIGKKDAEIAWGSSKQCDEKMSTIFHLWLLISLLTSKDFNPTMTIEDSHGEKLEEAHLDMSYNIIALQLEVALETNIQQCRDQLRKLDANILNQSYKPLFNLIIGMFVILDAVEKYCCFVIRRETPIVDYHDMCRQAQRLAHKYAYCAQNIQMIPKTTIDSHGMMVPYGDGSTNGKVDHEMQRIWMMELCISGDDLETYLVANEDSYDQWLIPKGRLWARLFKDLDA